MALRQIGYSNSPSGTALRAVPRLLLAFPEYNKVALEQRTHPNRLWARSFLGIDTAGNGWPRSPHGAQTQHQGHSVGLGERMQGGSQPHLRSWGEIQLGTQNKCGWEYHPEKVYLCYNDTNSLPHLSSGGEVYLPSSWIWAGSGTCSDQQKVVHVSLNNFQYLALRDLPLPPTYLGNSFLGSSCHAVRKLKQSCGKLKLLANSFN